MTTRLKLWGGLIVLFCAGALSGIVADSVFLHAESTPHRPRDAVEEGKAAEALLKREGRQALVGYRGADADPVA